MDEELRRLDTLSSLEIDTIGEILNISMGSAATAISTMLDRQVMISTPTVDVRGFSSLDYVELDPAMLVKINYVEGISGSNVMIFKQTDMKVILSLLMGMDEDDDSGEPFVFDELAISAACEIMNQMMGASATALADILGITVNISTPEAYTADFPDAYRQAVNVAEGEKILSVSFQLTIDGVMESNFASVLTVDFARDIIRQVMGEQERAMEGLEMPPETLAPPPPPPPPQQQMPPPQQTGQPPAPPPAYSQPPSPPPQAAPYPPPSTYPPPGYPPMPDPAYPAYPGYYPPPYGQSPYGQPPYGQPPYGQPPYAPPAQEAYQQPAQVRQPINVQTPQFPTFPQGAQSQHPATSGNMDMLMRVSLDVSVEIGKTKRKIKDILDFGQGTVIELNKQAGAPVDIVVNGCLLARGDVVVIDDNFGVRVTEILGAKELLETLKEENGL